MIPIFITKLHLTAKSQRILAANVLWEAYTIKVRNRGTCTASQSNADSLHLPGADVVCFNDKALGIFNKKLLHRITRNLVKLEWHMYCLFNMQRYATKWSNSISVSIVIGVPSVLWRRWLGGRKGIRPVKNRVVGCWCGYLPGARCRLAYIAQLMPLPLTVSCFSKIQIGFIFLVPAHLGSPGKRAVKQVCVCSNRCSSAHCTDNSS